MSMSLFSVPTIEITQERYNELLRQEERLDIVKKILCDSDSTTAASCAKAILMEDDGK